MPTTPSERASLSSSSSSKSGSYSCCIAESSLLLTHLWMKVRPDDMTYAPCVTHSTNRFSTLASLRREVSFTVIDTDPNHTPKDANKSFYPRKMLGIIDKKPALFACLLNDLGNGCLLVQP